MASFPQPNLWTMWTKILASPSFPRFPQGFPQGKKGNSPKRIFSPAFRKKFFNFVSFAQNRPIRADFCTFPPPLKAALGGPSEDTVFLYILHEQTVKIAPFSHGGCKKFHRALDKKRRAEYNGRNNRISH